MTIKRGILLLLLLAALPLNSAAAIENVGATLFYLAPGENGVLQVWRIGAENTPEQLTSDTSAVLDYDISYDRLLAYVTARSLNVAGTAVTTGGPLDVPAVQLVAVDWSPTGTQLAVVAYDPNAAAGVADPAEGVWLYDKTSGGWAILLRASRTEGNVLVYTEVDWSPAGDRLLLDASFGETSGSALHSMNTNETLVYNLTGTGGYIDERGYGRASWSPDAAALVLSDVPDARTGNGYILSANNFTQITLIMDAESQFYLSHPKVLRNGVLYIRRDFNNNSTVSEIWERLPDGTSQQLGEFPTADIYDVVWAGNGQALVYLDDFDGTAAAAHLMIRGDSGFSEVSLPDGVDRIIRPQWILDPPQGVGQISGLVFTEPLFNQVTSDDQIVYAARMQWNPISGASGYRLTFDPALNGETTFDVDTIAAQLGLLPCGMTFTISVSALDPTGNPAPGTATSSLTIPVCELTGTTETATEAAPEGEATTEPSSETTTPPDAAQPQPTPTSEPVTPATVVDLTAGEFVAGATLEGGAVIYSTTLTWTAPQENFDFYLLQVDPPIGAEGRANFPVRSEDPTITATLDNLACAIAYTVRVQTLAEDAITVLATSAPVTIQKPTCP